MKWIRPRVRRIRTPDDLGRRPAATPQDTNGEARIFDRRHDVIDFTIGNDHENPRDCVCPLALIYDRISRDRIRPIPARPAGQRKFCVMVCRHLPLRETVYRALGEHRQIDGYGRMFGRAAIGKYWDEEFLQLLSQYKFVVCFENQLRHAYHSEKIVNPILAGSVPIYWGSSFVDRFISRGRFLMLDSPDGVAQLVHRVREVDENDALFESMVLKHPWAEGFSWEEVDARHGCRHAIERAREWLGIR
jgi:hypothetical protein